MGATLMITPGLYQSWKSYQVFVEGAVRSADGEPGLIYTFTSGPRAGEREWRSERDWNSRPGGTDGPLRFRPVSSIVRPNLEPMSFALDVFREFWPDAPVEVAWVPGHDCPGSCYFVEGRPPFVAIGMNLPMEQAIGVLLHELAHVVTGHEADHHGPEFDAALSRLTAAYEARVAAFSKIPGFVVQNNKEMKV